MNEKEFEQILIKHPELIEEGIVFKGNQVNLEGKQLDLLFEDKNGLKLIVEVKLIARRKDIAQLIDYAGYFIEKEKKPIRAMLVALRIPTNYRYSFNYFGFEHKEISENELLKVLPQIAEKEIFYQPPAISQEATSQHIKSLLDETIQNQHPFQNEKNLTRQSMAIRIKGGTLFKQARHAVEFLKKASAPVSMKEFTAYMKSINYKSKGYYDLFNALCDSELVKSTKVENGCKAYLLADD